jgi:hypothetical protein
MRVRWMLLLAFVAMPALAAEIKVTVKQLPRRAWRESLTATKSSFDRYLHVVADADIALDMTIVSPFAGDASGALAAHTLTPTTLALKRGIAQLVLVTVSRVERADVYRGTIAFRDKTPRDIMHVEVALDVRVKPAFAAPPAQSIARVSHRDGNDWLARLLVGSESVDGKALLKVQSTTPQKVHIAAADVLATGAKNGREVGATLIDVKTITSSDVGIIRFPVTVDRANLAPDRYSGSVLISAGEAGDTYLTVPFDISVRAAPLLPLLFVILGVAGGKFVKYMNDKGNRQADLIIRIERVDKLLATKDRDILLGDLEKARQQIYLGDLDNADATILSLERRANALRSIDRWSAALGEAGGQAAQQMILILEAFRVEVLTSVNEAKLAEHEATVVRILAEAAAATVTRNASQKKAADADGGSVARWFADRQEATQRWLAEATPLIRFVMYLALLGGLIYAGMQTLYVSNATFGANGVADYVALLVWGLATEVTSTTLANIGSIIRAQ